MGGAVLHKLPGRARGGGVRPLRDRPRWGGERSTVAPRRLQLVENCGRGGGRRAPLRPRNMVRCRVVTSSQWYKSSMSSVTCIISITMPDNNVSRVQACVEQVPSRLEWTTILGRLAESAMDSRRRERLKRTAPRQVAPESTSRGKLRHRAPVQGRCGSPARPGGQCHGGRQ
jgi:hypothetical protein